jgi:myosin heavy subunit
MPIEIIVLIIVSVITLFAAIPIIVKVNHNADSTSESDHNADSTSESQTTLQALQSKVQQLENDLNKANFLLNASVISSDKLAHENQTLMAQLQEHKEKSADVELLLQQKQELEEHLKKITSTAVTQTQEQDHLIAQKEQELQEIAARYADLCEKLAGAQATNRAMLKAQDLENEGAWEIKIPVPREKLRKLLEEVAANYPEIASQISKLEWQECWMPVLQDIRKRGELDKVSGIYRLVLKEDPRICYIGQAKDLGERWMTHCKKMVGAENTGKEKLYEYRPDQFEWTVLERDVPVAMLDGKERYWIDFYKAAEIGLNSKRA